MLEKHMEDLIAQFPDEFFHRHKFTLKNRQKSFAGVGRFDLLFEDTHGTQILMELKAVPAKYEDATQLAKYKDELEARGESNILMWLVAPQISKSVCDFLDKIGIEHSEIHEAEFRQVAGRHGITLEIETGPQYDHAQSSIEPPYGSPVRSYGMAANKVEKAWLYWTDERGRKLFLAFVNQKGSCNIRFFDAGSGTFLGKQYSDGDYQEAFRNYFTSGTPVYLSHQPNLEKVCKGRLPDPVLSELRQQIPRPPAGSS